MKAMVKAIRKGIRRKNANLRIMIMNGAAK
jgi:hypothetical protein